MDINEIITDKSLQVCDRIEQYVMAYSVEQDKLRAILPDGFRSLRPVLRINSEIRNGSAGYIEFNTAVQREFTKGWLNIGRWEDVPFLKKGKTVMFRTEFLEITFHGTGIEGTCPAEKDNAGCFFIEKTLRLQAPQTIAVNKEFCDCSFAWRFKNTNAHGKSIGKTIPAYPTEVAQIYPKKEFTAENAADIPCSQVLGAYTVAFTR